MGGKYWDITNDVKLQEVVSNQSAFKKRIFIHTKHAGDWLSVGGTMVIGTVLATTKICDFHMVVITLIPLTSKINVMVACRQHRCVTFSAKKITIPQFFS